MVENEFLHHRFLNLFLMAGVYLVYYLLLFFKFGDVTLREVVEHFDSNKNEKGIVKTVWENNVFFSITAVLALVYQF